LGCSASWCPRRRASLCWPILPTSDGGPFTRAELEPAARVLGLLVQFYDASTNQEIDAAYAKLVDERPDALFFSSDGVLHQPACADLAGRTPCASRSVREFVEAGGLMSYGTNITDMYRQVGVYSGRILKGEKPGDLPVLQPTKFDMVINLTTAKALGISIPHTLIALADEVIDAAGVMESVDGFDFQLMLRK